MPRDKFPDAATLFSLCRQADQQAVDAIEESNRLRALAARMIEHNGNKIVRDGANVWIGHIQGCNAIQYFETVTPEMLELPEDLREAEPEAGPPVLGERYRINEPFHPWDGFEGTVTRHDTHSRMACLTINSCNWSRISFDCLTPIGKPEDGERVKPT